MGCSDQWSDCTFGPIRARSGTDVITELTHQTKNPPEACRVGAWARIRRGVYEEHLAYQIAKYQKSPEPYNSRNDFLPTWLPTGDYQRVTPTVLSPTEVKVVFEAIKQIEPVSVLGSRLSFQYHTGTSQHGFRHLCPEKNPIKRRKRKFAHLSRARVSG